MIKFLTILALLFLSVSTIGRADTKDYVKPDWCLPAYPFGMIVAARATAGAYLVGQTGAGLNGLGVVQLKGGAAPQKGSKLNLLVQYVQTKTMRGDDGFDHKIDMWRQCDKLKTQ